MRLLQQIPKCTVNRIHRTQPNVVVVTAVTPIFNGLAAQELENKKSILLPAYNGLARYGYPRGATIIQC